MSAVVALRAPQGATDEELFSVWEWHMRAASCSERTIRERRVLFRSLGEFLGCPVIEASRHQLIAFLARPHLSPKTRQNYKSFLHTAYTLWQDEGFRADNPAARLPRGKSPRIEANPFSTAEVQQLLDSGIYGRTRMMVLLAAVQGFRATEIASTSGKHINWPERMILTVDAKGGHEVWRPLHPQVLEHAEQQPKRFRRDDWWFPSIGGREGHVTAKAVSTTISQAMKRAGIMGHRPHQLRAWYATELLNSGADMLTIQHAMRHAGPGTLRHYIRPDLAGIAAAQDRLPSLQVPTIALRGGRG
jgi:integrase